jgi:hypothetical protein
MPEIVHITFEKLTGLPGTIEGDFVCEDKVDTRLPLILNAFLVHNMTFVFTQDEKYVYMKLVNWRETVNYLEHFLYGRNLLIKEWTVYGSGVDTGIKNPN